MIEHAPHMSHLPAPMVTLHKFAYAPSTDDFFSSSPSPSLFGLGRRVPPGDLNVGTRRTRGLKNGELGTFTCGIGSCRDEFMMYNNVHM